MPVRNAERARNRICPARQIQRHQCGCFVQGIASDAVDTFENTGSNEKGSFTRFHPQRRMIAAGRYITDRVNVPENQGQLIKPGLPALSERISNDAFLG